jgi:hypothetical protein
MGGLEHFILFVSLGDIPTSLLKAGHTVKVLDRCLWTKAAGNGLQGGRHGAQTAAYGCRFSLPISEQSVDVFNGQRPVQRAVTKLFGACQTVLL